MTFGERDGAPFFHCHGLWTETDGHLHGGHILPEESIVAESVAVDAFGIDGAMFAAEPDAETNFKLFGPVARPATDVKVDRRAFALRLRPNQDFAAALETFCRQHGVLRARIHGGVGSTIGAQFTDGRSVVPFATEIAITAGTIAPGPRRHAAGRSTWRWWIISQHRRRTADARRQSSADDDGTGAGSDVSSYRSSR